MYYIYGSVRAIPTYMSLPTLWWCNYAMATARDEWMTLVICCPIVCSVKQSWPWAHASTCYIQSAPAPWLDLCCYSAMMMTLTGHVLTCSSWACTLIKSSQDHDDVGILHMHYELVDNILLHAHIHTYPHTYIHRYSEICCMFLLYSGLAQAHPEL